MFPYQWLLFFTKFGGGLAVGVVCMLMGKRIMIVFSSLIGGILISHNIGFMFGALPNFFAIIDEIKSGKKMVGL